MRSECEKLSINVINYYNKIFHIFIFLIDSSGTNKEDNFNSAPLG